MSDARGRTITVAANPVSRAEPGPEPGFTKQSLSESGYSDGDVVGDQSFLPPTGTWLGASSSSRSRNRNGRAAETLVSAGIWNPFIRRALEYKVKIRKKRSFLKVHALQTTRARKPYRNYPAQSRNRERSSGDGIRQASNRPKMRNRRRASALYPPSRSGRGTTRNNSPATRQMPPR